MITEPLTSTSAPMMPERLYGIVPKAPGRKDYLKALVWGVLCVVTGVAGIIMNANGYNDIVVVCITMTGIGITFTAMMSEIQDPSGYKHEANIEGNKRFHEWEKNTLIPFLEEKHGVKFDKGASFVQWGWPTASKDGLNFEVQVKGIDFRERSFGGDEDCFWFPILEEEKNVYLAKVNRPKSVTYEDLEEI